jgi:hypothetical protein
MSTAAIVKEMGTGPGERLPDIWVLASMKPLRGCGSSMQPYPRLDELHNYTRSPAPRPVNTGYANEYTGK